MSGQGTAGCPVRSRQAWAALTINVRQKGQRTTEVIVEHEAHMAILARYAAEVWTDGDLDAVEAYIAQDYVRHQPRLPIEVHGPEGVRHLVGLYRTAFPDLRIEVLALVSEADQLVGHWIFHGTYQGGLFGIPPTGRLVAFSAMERFRFKNGKIVEQWVIIDELGLLQQLEVAATSLLRSFTASPP